jgi:hypothetical protein
VKYNDALREIIADHQLTIERYESRLDELRESELTQSADFEPQVCLVRSQIEFLLLNVRAMKLSKESELDSLTRGIGDRLSGPWFGGFPDDSRVPPPPVDSSGVPPPPVVTPPRPQIFLPPTPEFMSRRSPIRPNPNEFRNCGCDDRGGQTYE